MKTLYVVSEEEAEKWAKRNNQIAGADVFFYVEAICVVSLSNYGET